MNTQIGGKVRFGGNEYVVEAIEAEKRGKTFFVSTHPVHGRILINSASIETPVEFATPCRDVKIKSDYYGDVRRMSARW